MKQQQVIKLLAGTCSIINQTSKMINERTISYIERQFIKGKYVSREEFEQLRTLVLKLEKKLNNGSNKT